ncbi:MAG: YqfO family protein [Candidatus Margulisiibacteriota bacterium]
MPKFCKLVVFVPLSHLEKIRAALCAAGAGKIGQHYDNCTFYTIGTGTFRPLKGAKPFLGQIGKVTRVKEARLETIVPRTRLKKVMAALKKAHPYEEPAYDLIVLL